MSTPSGSDSNEEVVAPIDQGDDQALMGPEARRVTASRHNEKLYLSGLGRLIPINTDHDQYNVAEKVSECTGLPLRSKRAETQFATQLETHSAGPSSFPAVSKPIENSKRLRKLSSEEAAMTKPSQRKSSLVPFE